jgi:hypothetical protein
MSVLSPQSVPIASPGCVVRELAEGGYLFYSPATDELHLVPWTGHYIFQLCDGLRSLAEIEQLVEDAFGEDRNRVHTAIATFVEGLVERRLLVI